MAKQTTQEPPNGKLADLTEGGVAVESRIANADHALKICQRCLRDNRERGKRMVKVQGAFDGNAPKSQADLARAGRANDSNLNYKRHRGHVMNAWTPLFDMRCEVPVCIDGQADVGDSSQNAAFMRGCAQFFHEMVFGWRGFDDTTQLTDLQMLLHGPGVLMWENAYDFRPKVVLACNFYVPTRTNTSLDNCEMAMAYTPYTAGDLWKKIKDPKEGDGWNVAAVQRAIMDSAKSGSTYYRDYNWSRWQQAFKNGDQYVSQIETNEIEAFTLFVEEMDGTVSEKIVPATRGSGKSFQFLFDGPARYDCWDQCICIFPYDIGADGTYHSMKGLGTDIYPFCALLNDIDNSTADLVKTSIKPMWQPTTNAKMEEFKMGKWGGGNFVPNGIAPLQVDISRGIQPALEVSQYLSQTLTQNTAASNNDLAAPTVEETARAAMIRATERNKVSKGLHNRYMRAVSREYAEMWRRAVNSDLQGYHPGAKEMLKFQAKCRRLAKKIGIEWEQQKDADDSPTGEAGKFTALQLISNVRANRSLGLGSAAMRIEIASQLMENIDRFDEIGQNEILRMWSAVMMSYDSVDALVPSLTAGRDKTEEESDAAGENNDMTTLGEAAEVLVVAGQNHILHLSIHLPSMKNDAAQCVQGQIDPRDCFSRLEAKGKHAHEHLAQIQSNPTKQRQVKEFSAELAPLMAYQDHLQQTIAEQDQAAAQQPQPGEQTPEMVKAQGSLQIKAQKEQGTMALRADKQKFDQEQKAQDQAFKQQLAAQQAEFDRRVSALEAAHKITTDRAVTQSQIENSQAASEA